MDLMWITIAIVSIIFAISCSVREQQIKKKYIEAIKMLSAANVLIKQAKPIIDDYVKLVKKIEEESK